MCACTCIDTFSYEGGGKLVDPLDESLTGTRISIVLPFLPLMVLVVYATSSGTSGARMG